MARFRFLVYVAGTMLLLVAASAAVAAVGDPTPSVGAIDAEEPPANNGGPVAAGEFRTGLHFTAEELAVWRQRAVSGPYKSPGDVSSNSPGDWERIVANKDAFMRDPSAGRYTTAELLLDEHGAIVADGTTHPMPSHAHSTRLRDAAFFALVRDDATVRAAVAKELYASTVGEPLVDTRNRTRWAIGSGYDWDVHPAFAIAAVFEKYLYTRDYIGRQAFTTSQNAAFDRWLYHAADTFVARRTQQHDNSWPNRYKNDYSNDSCSSPMKLYDNAPTNVMVPGRRANNRQIHLYEFAVPAALYLQTHGHTPSGGDPGRSLQQIVDVSKQAVRDLINVAVYPHGALSDFERGRQSAGIALHYGSAQVASITWIAEHLARAGDHSLYTYQTTAGHCGTAGAPTTGEAARGIHYANRTIARYYNGTYKRTWDGQALNGSGRIDDTRSLPIAARYYKDSMLTNTYTRRTSGTVAYPSNPPGYHGQSAWTWAGQYPGILFMYGQMENSASPHVR